MKRSHLFAVPFDGRWRELAVSAAEAAPNHFCSVRRCDRCWSVAGRRRNGFKPVAARDQGAKVGWKGYPSGRVHGCEDGRRAGSACRWSYCARGAPETHANFFADPTGEWRLASGRATVLQRLSRKQRAILQTQEGARQSGSPACFGPDMRIVDRLTLGRWWWPDRALTAVFTQKLSNGYRSAAGVSPGVRATRPGGVRRQR